MSSSPPVYVIGGGLIGLMTAFYLTEASERVVVLDRGRVGGQSSWAGGGILSPLYPWRYPDPVNRLAQWGQHHYPELIAGLRRETGVDAEWCRTGMLVVEPGDSERALAWSQHWGGDWAQVDRPSALALEPRLAPHLAEQALYAASLAHVRNPRLIKALHFALAARGVQVQENVAFQGVVARGGCLVGLRLDGQELVAERCLIAAGAWTGELLRDTGLTLPIRPVRGQMLMFKAETTTVRRMILRGTRYVIPRRDGRVLVGSTVEEAGYDAATTDTARAELHASAAELVPALANYPIEAHWAGLRPGSPEGIPYIGTHPAIDGLYVSAGHYRNGIVLAPASARLAADLMLKRPPILDPEPYRLESNGKIG